MPQFDLSLEQLQSYAPDVRQPADFDDFWQRTLAEARQYPLNAQFTPVDFGLRTVKTYDVSFAGFGGQSVKGWLLLPAHASAPLPAVLEFIGYGGGRGLPTQWLAWASAGYAFMVMDTRGQGSSWSTGDTPDIPNGANPHYPGFMTQGITDPHNYYYRRVFTDAVRALEAFKSHPMVDETRIAVTGASQGGGITLALSGLAPEDVKVTMPDVPFLCHFQRALAITPDPPYTEIVRYLRVHLQQEEAAYNTLSYFDGVNFSRRIQARALFCTALMDTICPPSTVFAAYNAIPHANKDMHVYPYGDHAGGGAAHIATKINYLQSIWQTS